MCLASVNTMFMRFVYIVGGSSSPFLPVGFHFAHFRMVDMEALSPLFIQGYPVKVRKG